ncbi:Hypothetical protein POVR2_LOCUS44 [uncultured virus]|nr:Hypothetical protein POVR2_LOCUS44 [uncultured virus]
MNSGSLAQEEVEWLMSNCVRYYVLLSAEDGNSRLVLCNRGSSSVQYELVMRCADEGWIVSNYESRGSASISLCGSSIASCLVGRGTPAIGEQQTIHFMSSGSHAGTTALLDVKSYFSLEKRRLEAKSSTKVVELARKMTLEYISSVALFYRERKHILELYLVAQLHLDKPNYESYKDIYRKLRSSKMKDDQLLQVAISNNCERYQEQVGLLVQKLN